MERLERESQKTSEPPFNRPHILSEVRRLQNMKAWSGEASVQRFQFDLFALKVVSLSFLP
jgi:hypothetical protein